MTVRKVLRRIHRGVVEKLQADPVLLRKYLGLARFLSTRGISPPLTSGIRKTEARWLNQGKEGSEVTPETYLACDDSVEKLFHEVLPLLNPDSAILEIGCNTGRSLDYLYRKGFHNLTGIEIGPKAVESFQRNFPDTFRDSTVICGNAVQELQKLKKDSYDLVFTHSVLVNISAADNNVFSEICRICRGYVLTLESEGSWTAFPRDFEYLFKKNGFEIVSYRWMVWNRDKTALVFPTQIGDEHYLENNSIRLFVPAGNKR